MYPNKENMIVVPIEKKNLKHQYRVSQCVERHCSANNKKNGEYYEYPGLSHLTDEH